MYKRRNFLIFIFPILLLSGCNITKHVPEDDYLYTGKEIVIDANGKVPYKKKLLAELEDVTGPEPNLSILGWRPKLWIYNLTGGPNAKGIGKWVQDRLGEPPILLSVVKPDRIQDLMINRLFNNGHFDPEVEYNVHKKKKKADIEYIAHINPPFTINEIIFPDGAREIEEKIRDTKENTLLKKGEPYNLNLLTEERERIDLELENQGYYYFSADVLIFDVDSTIGDRKLNVYLSIKKDAPQNAVRLYRLNKVYVNTHHIQGESPRNNDTLQVNNYKFISRYGQYRPKPILRAVFIEKDSLYSRESHVFTLNRLMGLGVFSFANIRYENLEEFNPGYLNAYVNLTPLRRKSIRAELQAVSKSNNFIGPSIITRFTNRNAFKGAELLQLNLTLGYETQLVRRDPVEEGGTSDVQRPTSFEFGAEGHLQVPRFIIPFKWGTASRFVPKTNFRLGYQHLNRTQYFSMNSFNASTGYSWRETTVSDHELNVININYLQLGDTTGAFHNLLEKNPFFRRSFEQQFIIGSNYTYTLNTQLTEEEPTPSTRRRHDFFFRGNIDVSGNLMHLIQKMVNAEDPTDEEPYTIFGTPYSQYTRVDTDFRYYFKPGESRTLATRLLLGAGFAYGNSITMPYVKQFFMGGPNSLRAFRARSVGPGSYRSDSESDDNRFFFDQVGDLRIEANIEYRFPLVSILKGAYFIDAGNIWLLESPTRPEGIFKSGNFIDQFAVGTGFGLRADVSFFVLRFDLGIPLRRPYEEKWLFNDFKWKKSVFNIAIGYPF